MNYCPPLCIAVCLLVAGCQDLHPLPLDEKGIVAGLDKVKVDFGLGVADKPKDAITQLKQYSEWYYLKSSEINEKVYDFDDTSFGFGLLGLAAGIAKEATAVMGATVLAASAKIPESRYSLKVQALNYEKASDAMYCMYSYLVPIKDGSTDKIPDVRYLNDSIFQVRRTLRGLQTKVNIASTNLDDLKQTIEAASAQRLKAETVTQQRINVAASDKAALKEKTTAENAELRKLAELEMKKCIDGFAEQ